MLLFELERKVDATGIRRYIRYFIPDAELDSQMLDVWGEFLQH